MNINKSLDKYSSRVTTGSVRVQVTVYQANTSSTGTSTPGDIRSNAFL